MEKYLHLEHDITVTVDDTDFKQYIKPGAAMGYFQDIASRHADLLGFGYADMLSKNLVWVILRMTVKIIKNPAIGEVLRLSTFPERPGASNVDRGYYIHNKAGELVICGSSKWCVIDADTHKIQRLAPVFENYNTSDFIPYPPFEGGNPKLGKLSRSDNPKGPFSYSVQVTDLDRNVHMNNARYGDVVLNVCGKDALEERSITRLDINFISQLFYGDRFDVYKGQEGSADSSANGSATLFEAVKILDDDNGSSDDTMRDVVFRARAEWR